MSVAQTVREPRLRVYGTQFSYRYGRQIHFPYSIATLVAHARSVPELEARYDFRRCFVFREEWETAAEQCRDADVLLCSCYVWNWQVTQAFAKRVRELRPDCLIVFGGPQVPDRMRGFFDERPYVDVVVHNEGERVLANVLRRFADGESPQGLKGVSLNPTRFSDKGARLPVLGAELALEPRIADLGALPSPYLEGTVWQLVERRDDIEWIAPWETTRGCPYQCTFCDWGSATYTKLRRFPTERLNAEIDWFSKERIVYVDCCDSNFGILHERDGKLAERLAARATQTGFPTTFRQSWAKNTSERIIPIAKTLQDGGLLTAVGLAVESLDAATLATVKRKNIAFSSFSELTRAFHDNGLPTYTEVIRGLPGETLESFKQGLELLLRDTLIGAIYVYHCTVLPNAELNHPEYRQAHGIQTVRSPVQLAHSSVKGRGMVEYEDIVVRTNTFSTEDLAQMYIYTWCALCLTNLGVMEYVFGFYRRTQDVSFMALFDHVVRIADQSQGAFGREIATLREYVRVGYQGAGWDHHDPKLGGVYWPMESASWLRLTWDNRAFEGELHALTLQLDRALGANTESAVLKDLCRFQAFVLSDRQQSGSHREETFRYDWLELFAKGGSGPAARTLALRYALRVDPSHRDFEWSKHAVWWGRRRQCFRAPLEQLEKIS